MRPERARRFQPPFPASGFDRIPRPANDNVPAAGGAVRRAFGRPLLLGTLTAVLVLALGWLGRGGQAF